MCDTTEDRLTRVEGIQDRILTLIEDNVMPLLTDHGEQLIGLRADVTDFRRVTNQRLTTMEKKLDILIGRPGHA